MPGFTITRGLGPGASPTHLIARGFIPAPILEAISIIRGGSRAQKKFYEENWELFKVSAAFVAHNGKRAVQPLFENIRKTFTESEIDIKKASAVSVEYKKPSDVKIKAQIVKLRNKKNV